MFSLGKFVHVMEDQSPLDITKGHNQAGNISYLQEKHYIEIKYMIVGLNTCKIAHALQENLVIYTDLIQDF
ncbi:hypothetical protein Hanom_Chr11g01006761 [Helianthus anomalus]